MLCTQRISRMVFFVLISWLASHQHQLVRFPPNSSHCIIFKPVLHVRLRLKIGVVVFV